MQEKEKELGLAGPVRETHIYVNVSITRGVFFTSQCPGITISGQWDSSLLMLPGDSDGPLRLKITGLKSFLRSLPAPPLLLLSAAPATSLEAVSSATRGKKAQNQLGFRDGASVAIRILGVEFTVMLPMGN